ncbi:hypothetical protein XAB3213_800002 [Xanthomonas citri pv. bilvae]|nr:hypothetical protein XAB3213_800002 [Xanthomonas citri pv. bilvae]
MIHLDAAFPWPPTTNGGDDTRISVGSEGAWRRVRNFVDARVACPAPVCMQTPMQAEAFHADHNQPQTDTDESADHDACAVQAVLRTDSRAEERSMQGAAHATRCAAPDATAYTAHAGPGQVSWRLREFAMLYRRLGSTGLQLSALSFGAWVTFGKQIGRSEARNLIAAAWDNGINFFDNAEVYARGRAEQVMGRCDRRSAFAARWFLRVEQGVLRCGGQPAADPARTLAQACHRCLPRRAQAPARGVPGSLLLPSARSGHPDPGNRTRHGCADPPGQGAVLGHVRMERRAVARSHRHCRTRTSACAGDGTAAIQPAAPRAAGARVRVAVRGRAGHHDLVAAGLGPADRQVQRGRGGRQPSGPAGQPMVAGRSAGRAGSAPAGARPRVLRGSGRAWPVARAVGHRLVPAQSTCIQRDPGREPGHTVGRKPWCLEHPGSGR